MTLNDNIGHSAAQCALIVWKPIIHGWKVGKKDKNAFKTERTQKDLI